MKPRERRATHTPVLMDLTAVVLLAACAHQSHPIRTGSGEGAEAPVSNPASAPASAPASGPDAQSPPAPPPESAPAEAESPPAEAAPAPATEAATAPATPPPTDTATAPPRRITPASRSGSQPPKTPAASAAGSPRAAPAPASSPNPGTASATPAHPPAPALDLQTLEQRLRETGAIGVFTKLSLKNQVDDLLAQFRAYHRGQSTLTLAQLRQKYEVLLLKVVTLLQDNDPTLASAISSSREALWGILTDPKRFANS